MLRTLSMNRLVVLVVLAGFTLDQLTKYLVVRNLPLRSSWPDEGFFRITHVGNTGSAFGLFHNQNLPLIVASFLGLAVLYYFYRSHPNPGLPVQLSLGLMVAGAIGNLTDRLVRGHVTDFIDIGPWWIFNLADASIVCGLAVLAVSMWVGRSPAAATPEGGDAPLSGVAPLEPPDEDDAAAAGR